MYDRVQEQAAGQGLQFEEIKEMALEYAATAREQWAEGNKMVRDYMAKEPLRALGIALGLGVFLGWWIKRR